MRGDDARVSKAKLHGTRKQLHRLSIFIVAIRVPAVCVLAIGIGEGCGRDGVRGRGGFVGLRGESKTTRESVSVGGCEKCSSARA